MSRAGRPNLPWAIPLYEGMKKYLECSFNDATLPPRLRQAVAAGLQKLVIYYRFAQNIASCEHVIRSYEETAPATQTPTMQAGPKPKPNNFSASIAQVGSQPRVSIAALESEFERYDADLAFENPLAWWKVSQFLCHEYLLSSH
jgi:hypothetical protein